MPANVEVKVRVEAHAALRARLHRVGARGPATIVQKDTYFGAGRGDTRLKLREERGATGRSAELIGYRRRAAAVRTSRFERTPVEPARAASLARTISRALGLRAVVRKRREVWLKGRDRIHLDRVAALGTFLEVEARSGPGPRAGERARHRLERVLADLGLAAAPRIPGSYVDLLEGRSR